MLFAILGSYFLSGLALLVLLSIVMLLFLLYKEYLRQEKNQLKRLRELEYLVFLESQRSKSITSQNESLEEIKSKTQEQLDLIKLQVKAMETLSKK